MNESGRIECVTGGFSGHSSSSKVPQFVVHKREQLIRGLAITRLSGFQEARYIGHGVSR